MGSADELWALALRMKAYEAGPLLEELAQMPGAEQAVSRTLQRGPRRESLALLGLPAAQRLAGLVAPELVRLAASSNQDVVLARDALKSLPAEALAMRLWPLAERCIESGADWEAPRRLAELFVELRQRNALEALLAYVATSDNIDWREVVEDFDHVWETPRWGSPVHTWFGSRGADENDATSR